MAITIVEYNHTTKKLLDLSMVDEAANFYLELLDGTTAFDATHTTKDEVDDTGADEIDGSGWPTGGVNLANVAVTVVDTSTARLDADDVSVTASGGNITGAFGAVVYVNEGDADTTYSPLWHVDFGEEKGAVSGDPFSIAINPAGLCTVVVI